jgi:hypothetical protein
VRSPAFSNAPAALPRMERKRCTPWCVLHCSSPQVRPRHWKRNGQTLTDWRYESRGTAFTSRSPLGNRRCSDDVVDQLLRSLSTFHQSPTICFLSSGGGLPANATRRRRFHPHLLAGLAWRIWHSREPPTPSQRACKNQEQVQGVQLFVAYSQPLRASGTPHVQCTPACNFLQERFARKLRIGRSRRPPAAPPSFAVQPPRPIRAGRTCSFFLRLAPPQRHTLFIFLQVHCADLI